MFLGRLAAHRRKAFDEERLAQEIEEHLTLQTEENQRSGLSPGILFSPPDTLPSEADIFRANYGKVMR